MKKLNADKDPGFLTNEEIKHQQNPSTYNMDQDKNTAEQIDQGVRLSALHQKMLALNVVSWKLVFAIVNGDNQKVIDNPALGNVNHTPGFTYHGPSLAIDIKTAIARAVSQSLSVMNKSHVGSSSDKAATDYKKQYANVVTKFGQFALAYSA